MDWVGGGKGEGSQSNQILARFLAKGHTGINKQIALIGDMDGVRNICDLRKRNVCIGILLLMPKIPLQKVELLKQTFKNIVRLHCS